MFRFSIRELMLITLVVGLALGWQIDHRYQTKSRQQHERVRQVTEQQMDDLVGKVASYGGLNVTRDSGGWATISKPEPRR
jgi:hypothetical protein